MFSGDSTALLSAKITISETLLGLLTRDIRFEEFMREVLHIAVKVVRSEAGSILEVDYDSRTLFFRASEGRGSGKLSPFTVPMGQGIAGFVAESLQPVMVTDAKENRKHLNAIAASVGFDARNLLAVPLVVRGRAFAVLELLNRIGEENYSQHDLELLTYYSEMAAKAIEVRLMLSWRKRHKRAPREEGAA